MNTGAVTGYFDVAQIVLYVFWIFFAGLILYLRREDKREGYPLESDRSGGRISVQGFPAIPQPKTYLLADGSTFKSPRPELDMRPILGTPNGPHPGAPLLPLGNPMRDAIGPAAFALRATHPDRALDGLPLILPLRAAPGLAIIGADPDPRGMTVYGGDGERGGTVREVWVDRAEPQIRYLEIETIGGRHVLLPNTFVRYDVRRHRVNVRSIYAAQFEFVPALSNPDQVTMREEDQIMAYFASGNLYATPARAEPFI